jgi:hypothetical protein
MENALIMIPPPLTGGGQGVGEAGTLLFHGTFPPTLALSRRGGGKVLETLRDPQ